MRVVSARKLDLLLAVLALVLPEGARAVEADQISTSRKTPTTVWILEGALDHDDDLAPQGCALEPYAEEAALPAGLRAAAHLIELDCGAVYLFLDLPLEVHDRRHTRWARTTLDAVSLQPPKKDPWRKAEPLREAFVWCPSGRAYLEAAPLDDPDWTETYRLAYGERVQVLAEEMAVLRTSTGRTVVASGWWQKDEDPILERGGRQLRTLRDRFTGGRALHEGGGIIRDLPPAESLLAGLAGSQGWPFQLDLDPEYLSGEVFDPAWLDPVGQVWERTCDDRRVRDGDPCGAYYLDYSAFGAWWPDKNTDVLAILDGTETVDGRRLPRLRVLVREPWSNKLEVSPGWDGE
ncbi:MAG: hypothetical protein QGH45_00620 [Myxococcota bacterium]|nr:hypothetical protein [Myxococcota bacterium]